MVRIKGFDGLRALAVLAVFICHKSGFKETQLGHAAVLLFFALSGFLIVGGLHRDRQLVETSGMPVRILMARFFRRRVLRIFPAYYLSLAVMAILAAIGWRNGWNWGLAPWFLGYASNVYIAKLGAWPGYLGHLWSLAIEEQFYILAAPVLLLLPSRFHGPLCTLVVCGGLVRSLVLAGEGHAIALWTDSLANCAYFGLGGFVRVVLARHKLPAAGPIAWACAIVIAGLALTPVDHRSALWSQEAATLLIGVASALLLLAVRQTQGSRLVRLLEIPPLIYLGTISYGFYLYANMIPMLWPLEFHNGLANYVVMIATTGGIALALSHLSFFLIERPIMIGGRSLIAARNAPAMA